MVKETDLKTSSLHVHVMYFYKFIFLALQPIVVVFSQPDSGL